jgi:hypothetical protein
VWHSPSPFSTVRLVPSEACREATPKNLGDGSASPVADGLGGGLKTMVRALGWCGLVYFFHLVWFGKVN